MITCRVVVLLVVVVVVVFISPIKYTSSVTLIITIKYLKRTKYTLITNSSIVMKTRSVHKSILKMFSITNQKCRLGSSKLKGSRVNPRKG